MAYTNCKTRVIDLKPLCLPSSTSTTEVEFRQVYEALTNDPKNQPAASHLRSAILSLTTGIAPPVAFPTETVYGLGADATNSHSIAGIFAAKGRPSDNPLIVHVSSVAHLERLYSCDKSRQAIPEVYRELVSEFWPGPLTILLPVPSNSVFAENVHPGQKTIGFRVPSSPIARFLISVTDRPIAAPSANSSGKPSPTTASHVLDDLNGKINFIIDGGQCDVGVESTVVDGLSTPPVILRPGGISRRTLRDWARALPENSPGKIWETIENAWELKHKPQTRTVSILEGSASLHTATGVHGTQTSSSHGQVNGSRGPRLTNGTSAAPRAPGMKYKHYSPTAPMYLFNSVQDVASDKIHSQITSRVSRLSSLQEQPSKRVTIGLLTCAYPAFFNMQKLNGIPAQKSTRELSDPIDTEDEEYASTSIVVDQRKIEVDLFSISLGQTPVQVANRLFSVLRRCDALNCDVIFAETPSFSSGQDQDTQDDYETVLERMQKAATEVIDLES